MTGPAIDRSEIESSPLYNDDLAPVSKEAQTWGQWDIAALWVGMSVCIPTYMLASSLIAAGMNWWQAILTVFLGNLIVVVPMVLNAHAGTKYGITFPVFARASFGVNGANVASILRAIVACGWFGIQTWIGGKAIYGILAVFIPSVQDALVLDFISNEHVQVNVIQLASFGAFWALNVGLFVWREMDSIKYVEKWGAPLLIGLGIALLVWAYQQADGFGPMLSKPDEFETTADFFKVFLPGLTAMVGFWATLSLNIPDFTRMARSQRDQVVGQIVGLNTTMPLYAFIGVAVTSATVVIFGEQIWDPVVLITRFDSTFVVVLSMFALVLATLTTNMAANVVSPAASFSNLAPRRIGLKTGCVITGIIGVLMMPWKLAEDPSGYIYAWLIGYSALLGPIGGILICDYFVIRKTKLLVEDLFLVDGAYTYHKGFNVAALIALVLAILPNVPGFLNNVGAIELTDGSIWTSLYHFAWFIGFGVAFVVYFILMSGTRERSA